MLVALMLSLLSFRTNLKLYITHLLPPVVKIFKVALLWRALIIWAKSVGYPLILGAQTDPIPPWEYRRVQAVLGVRQVLALDLIADNATHCCAANSSNRATARQYSPSNSANACTYGRILLPCSHIGTPCQCRKNCQSCCCIFHSAHDVLLCRLELTLPAPQLIINKARCCCNRR